MPVEKSKCTTYDGNDVGGDVGRHVTTLGLDDGQSRQGASTKLVVHLGRTLQKPGVEVEDVSGVSLTTGGTTKQEGHLTVSDGLLGQVVKDDETVASTVTEPLSHGRAGEGREVLQGCSLGGGGGNDDGVLEGIVLLQSLDELSDGGTLLTDGDVDTVELLGLVLAVVPSLLVEDGIEGDGGLASLTITNDQLTLTTSNGHHSVDGLETSLHRLVDGTTGQDTGSLDRGTATLSGLDGALAVNGVAESIDDTSEELGADGDVDDLTGSLDNVSFLDETVATEDGHTDIVGFQVQAHAADTR